MDTQTAARERLEIRVIVQAAFFVLAVLAFIALSMVRGQEAGFKADPEALINTKMALIITDGCLRGVA